LVSFVNVQADQHYLVRETSNEDFVGCFGSSGLLLSNGFFRRLLFIPTLSVSASAATASDHQPERKHHRQRYHSGS
jgi:hypothetical protein